MKIELKLFKFILLKANSTGRGEKPVREYLEEHYSEETTADEASVLKLVVKALSQVVQSGAQNIEIAVMRPSDKLVIFYYDICYCCFFTPITKIIFFHVCQIIFSLFINIFKNFFLLFFVLGNRDSNF